MLPDRTADRIVGYLAAHPEHADKTLAGLIVLESCERRGIAPTFRLDSVAENSHERVAYARAKKALAWLGDEADKCKTERELMQATIAKARPELAGKLDGATTAELGEMFAALPDAPTTQNERAPNMTSIKLDAKDPTVAAQLRATETMHRAHLSPAERERAERLDADRPVEPVAAQIRALRELELTHCRDDAERAALRAEHARFDAQIADDRRFVEELAKHPVTRLDEKDPDLARILAGHERFYQGAR